MSDDGTRELISKYLENYPFIKMINNYKKITPVAMNLGINETKGNYIIILSSHSEVDKNFLRLNVESFEKFEADCVGGTMVTLPGNNNLIGKAIAVALSHPFGVGNSYFRIGSKEPRYVDTVPFGCYRKEVFSEIGLFNEDLIRNQDDEFNLRLIRNGGKVLLVPDIISYYHARDSLAKLWKMYYQYGHFKPLVAKKVGGMLTWRQLVPTVFVFSLIVSGLLSIVIKPFILVLCLLLFLYLFSTLFFSFSVSLNKGFRLFFILPIVFATVHFSYGMGYLNGIWNFVITRKNKRGSISDVPMTR